MEELFWFLVPGGFFDIWYLGADVALVARVSLLAGALTRPPVASLGEGADL